MINEEKGHLFYWKHRDFEPLRALIALALAAGALYLLFFHLPIPYTRGNAQLKENRRQTMLNHSGTNAIHYLSKDTLAALDPDVDFNLYDQFGLTSHFLTKSQQSASKEFSELKTHWESNLPTYKIQFKEVPYFPLTNSEKKPLKPSLFHRKLPKDLSVKAPVSAPRMLSLALSESLPSLRNPSLVIPFKTLNTGSDRLEVEIHITPKGEVAYAVPLNMNQNHPLLLEWVKKLVFLPTENGAYGRITLREVIAP